MLTKRKAIAAIYMGCLTKMAHADQPSFSSTGSMVTFKQQPQSWTWTVNLDQMTGLVVILGDRKITITTEEIFAALNTP